MIQTAAINASEVQHWQIERLVPYARNPRKNDAALDRMAASIREFGFKIPVLARSSGEVVDGHLRLKAARKLGITEVPVILCDEWSDAQVKAFRLMVNRSVGWAEWDAELLGLELLELKDLAFDLELTGFDSREIDEFLSGPDLDEGADAVPPVPDHPASDRTRVECRLRHRARKDGHWHCRYRRALDERSRMRGTHAGCSAA